MGIPYYKKRELKFKCQKCGACCSDWQGNVYLRQEDIPGLASATGLTPGQFVVRYTKRDAWGHVHLVLKENGDCVFFENGGCAVYDVRPGACFAWPFWRGVCTTKRGWEKASRKCPGIGKGATWSAGEIEARLVLSP